MKMIKKVFMILAVVALVLTMVGGVSAATQSVNNSTLSNAGNSWASNLVTVKLNLENDYVVVIPDDFTLTTSTRSVSGSVGSVKYYSTPESGGPELDFQITLLTLNSNLTVTVNSSQYNSSYDPNVDVSDNYLNDGGAWVLSNQEGTAKLHYVMAVGTAHIIPTENYDQNGKLAVRLQHDGGARSKFIYNGTEMYRTNSSVKLKLHAVVVDKPSVVTTYTDQLTFTVKYEGPTT